MLMLPSRKQQFINKWSSKPTWFLDLQGPSDKCFSIQTNPVTKRATRCFWPFSTNYIFGTFKMRETKNTRLFRRQMRFTSTPIDTPCHDGRVPVDDGCSLKLAWHTIYTLMTMAEDTQKHFYPRAGKRVGMLLWAKHFGTFFSAGYPSCVMNVKSRIPTQRMTVRLTILSGKLIFVSVNSLVPLKQIYSGYLLYTYISN